MRHRWRIWFFAFALIFMAGAAYIWWPQASGPSEGYRLARIERGDVVAGVSATGNLHPVVSVQVGSQVSGQIKEIYVDYNSPVKKGDLIARIEPQVFALRVEQAMADLNSARSGVITQRANIATLQAEVGRHKVNLAEAEREYKRNQALAEKGFVSGAVRDKAQSGYEASREQVKAAEAQLEVGRAQLSSAELLVKQRETQVAQARVELGHTEIRSPVDGIVVKKSIEPGQTVAASLQTPDLFLIAQDLRRMQVLASIDESEIGRVRIGQPATFRVDSFPSRTFTGTVVQIRKSAQVTQNVVTYLAVIETSNDDLSLYPGMTANLRIVVDKRENVLKIPVAALRFRPSETLGGKAPPLKADAGRGPGTAGRIWVLGEDGKAQALAVRLGLTDGTHTEIVQGDVNEQTEVIVGTAGPGAPKKRSAPRIF